MAAHKEFRLNVRTDNDAFSNDDGAELARILRAVADKIESDPHACGWFQTVRDINGNDVGRFALKHADYWDK